MYSSIETAPAHNFRAIGPLFMEIMHFKELGIQKCHHKCSVGVKSIVIDTIFM